MSLHLLPDIIAQLWPFAALLYLVAGLGWAGTNGVQFTALGGRRFHRGRSPLTFAGLLPFSLAVTASRRGPLPGPEGVWFPHSPERETVPYRTADYTFVPYEALAPLAADGQWLLARGVKRFRAQTGAEARSWTRTLAALARSGKKGRVSLLRRWARRAANPGRLTRPLALLLQRTLLIRWLARFLFVLFFLLLPAIVYGGLAPYVRLWVLMGYVAALALALAALVVPTYRRLYRAGWLETLGGLASPLCYPLLFGAPLAQLGRELAAGLDVFTVDAALLDRERALEGLRRERYALDHPVEADEPFQGALEVRKALTDGLFQRLGATREERSPVPPVFPGGEVASWCPVCDGQYLERTAHCLDCAVETLEPKAEGNGERAKE